MVKRTGRRAALRLLAAAAAAACTPAPGEAVARTAVPTPTATATVTPPPRGGRVTAYSTLGQAAEAALVEAFTKSHPGTELEIVPLPGAGDVQTRLTIEKAARADVFLGGGSEFHAPLGAQGLLEPYASPAAQAVPAGLKDPSGLWTGWYLEAFGVAAAGGRRADGWDDLADSSWKGRLALPDPARTTAGFAFLTAQVFRFARDEQKAMDYLKRLHANEPRYTGTAAEAVNLVRPGPGQVLGAVGWSHDVLGMSGIAPTWELAVPAATGFAVGSVSILKGARNGATARALVDWLLTPEAGNTMVRSSRRWSTLGAVAPPAGAPPLAHVSLATGDREWAIDNRTRLVRLWQRSVGA